MRSKNIVYISTLSVALVLAWQVYVYACTPGPTAYVEFATTDDSDLDRPNGPQDYYHYTSWPYFHCVRIGGKGLGLSFNASSLGSSMGANSYNPHVAERFTEMLDGRSRDLDIDFEYHLFQRLDRWQSGIRQWYWYFADGYDYWEYLYNNGYDSEWVWHVGDFYTGDGESSVNGCTTHFYQNPGWYYPHVTVTDDDKFEGVSPEDLTDTYTARVLAFDMEISCDKGTIAVSELVPVTLSFSPNPCDTGLTMLQVSEFRLWYIDGVKVYKNPDRSAQILPYTGNPDNMPFWFPPNPSGDPSAGMPNTVWVEATEPGTLALDLSFCINNGGDTVSMDRLELEAWLPELEILSPCDKNGNGRIDDPWYNEFPFDAGDPALLEIQCEAGISNMPGGVDEDMIRWTIEDIGNVRGKWSPHVPGNEYVGTGLFSSVTFTGMPEYNSDFGEKVVTLGYEGLTLTDTETIEVFFDALARNNPGPPAETPPGDIAEEDLID